MAKTWMTSSKCQSARQTIPWWRVLIVSTVKLIDRERNRTAPEKWVVVIVGFDPCSCFLGYNFFGRAIQQYLKKCYFYLYIEK